MSSGSGSLATTEESASHSGRRIDWLTLGIAAAICSGFFLLTVFFTRLPLWFAAPFGAVLLAWYGSLQHETIHGHPTPSRLFNSFLAGPPLTLWIPYAIYRETHWRHHRYGGRRLTQVGHDPESFYVSPGSLAKAGPLRRAILQANCTLAGRILLGPAIGVVTLWKSEARAIAAGDTQRAIIWLRHILGVAAVLAWTTGVCRIPLHTYILLVVYPSMSLTLLRSFAEHRADELAARRTNVVEAHPWWALIFLNNNLHIAHHEFPHLPWHQLPRAWCELKQGSLEKGVIFQGGYREVARKYLFRSFIHPEHPAGTVAAD